MAWTLLTHSPSTGRLGGIAAIVIAVFLLSFSDALVKLSGEQFGLAQLVFLRSLAAIPFVAFGCLLSLGASALGTRRTGWVWGRSMCLSAMWLAYYAALPLMSFALAAACYYTAPVWMALMARLLLGVQIGRRGWTAIALTMIGVIVVVNPRADEWTPVLLLPLTAAVFYALAGTITWARCQGESAAAMALNLNICLCAVGAVGLLVLSAFPALSGETFILAIWPGLRPLDWGIAFLLGLLLAIIATLVALAYRLAPTPVVGVFDTAYLGFAALWGAVFFAEIPSLREAIGIALIAIGAIMIGSTPSRQSDL